MLAHKAEEEGKLLWPHCTGHVNFRHSWAYTHPEIAWWVRPKSSSRLRVSLAKSGNVPILANGRAGLCDTNRHGQNAGGCHHR
jgi:hypothetical protein